MKKSGDIVSYSIEELREKHLHGESKTDWARVDALTEEELEASIDKDEEGEFDWDSIVVGLPPRKQSLNVRYDADIIEYFKSQGKGYQTMMNAVLRRYVDAQKARQ